MVAFLIAEPTWLLLDYPRANAAPQSRFPLLFNPENIKLVEILEPSK